jgi:hypothetical protein
VHLLTISYSPLAFPWPAFMELPHAVERYQNTDDALTLGLIRGIM